MEKSTTITEIAKALANFQGKVATIKKDGENPFFKSKYATLENVIETIRKPLSEAGLSFAQFPCGENELTTIIMHISGEYLQSTVKINPKDNTPQSQGSAITYMRRYALSAVLGLATEEDDDGNEASKPSKLKQSSKAIVEEDIEGKVCDACKSNALVSAKTGKAYCPNWKKHKEKGEKYNLVFKTIIGKNEEAFYEDMPEQK